MFQTKPWGGTSISQIQTYELSPRKWFFQKILKLPEVAKDSFTYGNALHGVLERYLGGKQLEDCFVQGWDDGLDFKQSLDITAMVRKAVNEGVIERLPNAFPPELSIKRELHPKLPLLFGKIDYATRDGLIVDHKSVSSKKYAKTSRDLQTDRQMRIYAWAVGMLLAESGAKVPELFKGRHNNFNKYNQEVWATEYAVINHESIKENLTECQEITALMVTDSRKQAWQDVCCTDACASAYGGCPFKNICNQAISLEGYVKGVVEMSASGNPFDNLKRVSTPTIVATAPPPVAQPVSTPPPSSAAAQAVFPKPAVAFPKPAQAEKAAPAPAAVAAPAAPEQAAPRGGPAPWADPACKACEGSGWTSKGTAPCRICAVTCGQRGVPPPSRYEIRHSPTGVPYAEPIGDGINGSLPQATAPRGQDTAPETASAPMAQPAAAPPEPPAAVPSAEEPQKRKRGRPRKTEEQAAPEPATEPMAEETPSVTSEQDDEPVVQRKTCILAIDCQPHVERGSIYERVPAWDLTWLVFDGPLGQVVAKQFGVEQYAAAPALKRQDLLVAIGPDFILNNFSGCILICTTGIVEFRPLIERLAQKSDLVFRGSR